MKHTPGPWKASLGPNGYQVKSGKKHICWLTPNRVVPRAIQDDQAEYNAWLIAQAPVFYSETKLLVDLLLDEPRIGSMLDVLNEEDFNLVVGQLNKLEAAIAAAEAE